RGKPLDDVALRLRRLLQPFDEASLARGNRSLVGDRKGHRDLGRLVVTLLVVALLVVALLVVALLVVALLVVALLVVALLVVVLLVAPLLPLAFPAVALVAGRPRHAEVNRRAARSDPLGARPGELGELLRGRLPGAERLRERRARFALLVERAHGGDLDAV